MLESYEANLEMLGIDTSDSMSDCNTTIIYICCHKAALCQGPDIFSIFKLGPEEFEQTEK